MHMKNVFIHKSYHEVAGTYLLILIIYIYDLQGPMLVKITNMPMVCLGVSFPVEILQTKALMESPLPLDGI